MHAGNNLSPAPISAHVLDIEPDGLQRIIDGITDSSPVVGFTHNFYRYPARFSPSFARGFIEALTNPGDLVVDPFVGGGTTLVETLVSGRRAIGADISSLATFISRVKTTPLPENTVAALRAWTDALPPKLNLQRFPVHFADWAEQGYYRNLECRRTWRIRKLLELAVSEVRGLADGRIESFVRCALLHTAQWALDGRKIIPRAATFQETLVRTMHGMLDGMEALGAALGGLAAAIVYLTEHGPGRYR